MMFNPDNGQIETTSLNSFRKGRPASWKLTHYNCVFYQHFMNDILCISTQMFFVLFFQLVYVDWFAIFQDNVGFLNSWKMVFPDISGAADRHRDDRTVCLCGNFEAALMEWKHVQFIFIFVSVYPLGKCRWKCRISLSQ